MCIRQPGPQAPACQFPCWLTSTLATLISDERCFWEKQTTCFTPVFFLQPQWLAKEGSHTVPYSSMCIIVKANFTLRLLYTPDHRFSWPIKNNDLVAELKQCWLTAAAQSNLLQNSVATTNTCWKLFQKNVGIALRANHRRSWDWFQLEPVHVLKWGIQKLSRKSERTLCLPDVVVFVLFCFHIPFPRGVQEALTWNWSSSGRHWDMDLGQVWLFRHLGARPLIIKINGSRKVIFIQPLPI